MGVGGVSNTWYSTYMQNTRRHIPENDSSHADHHENVYVCVLLYASVSWVTETTRIFQLKPTPFSSFNFLFKMKETLRLGRPFSPSAV
jgi:hypothetical protein